MDFLPTYVFVHAGRSVTESLGDLATCRNEWWKVEEYFPEMAPDVMQRGSKCVPPPGQAKVNPKTGRFITQIGGISPGSNILERLSFSPWDQKGVRRTIDLDMMNYR